MLKPGERAPVTDWIAAHRDAVMMGVALVGVLVLLVWDLSMWGFLILALLIGALELLAYRIGAARKVSAPGSGA